MNEHLGKTGNIIDCDITPCMRNGKVDCQGEIRQVDWYYGGEYYRTGRYCEYYRNRIVQGGSVIQ